MLAVLVKIAYSVQILLGHLYSARILLRILKQVIYKVQCESKACFKRRATAVLSWLDCSSTAARH